MESKRPRRTFTAEFKASAVGLVLEEGRSITQVAKDLDLTYSSLNRWVEQARADAGKSKRGTLTSDEKAELARLRKENRELRLDRDILKKSGGLLREGERLKFAFIHAEKASQTPVGTVSQMCRSLMVSRAGFYAWCGRPESQRAKSDRLLAVKVAEAYQRGWCKYGSPRVHRELRKQNIAVSRKRVIRLMQEQALVGRPKKRFVVTTDGNHALEVAPNVLDRDFTASAPNQKWAGDITYLKTPEGWLYLAAIIDLFSRFIVGWAVSPKIDRHLVLAALDMGQKRRGKVAGALFHSDRGSQYASEDYRTALIEGGFTCSMSRRGNCHDNAVSESWFSTLKAELGEAFVDHATANRELFRYIEVFYNQQRIHSTLDYVSPAEFERNAASAA